MDASDVYRIYTGSDGDATKRLYAHLGTLGPLGDVGTNLFRAQKCSERAKRYRGGLPGKGSYRDMAYARKDWSLGLLCECLERHAGGLGIVWGWARDPLATGPHVWVLYVDLPATGQVSFHTSSRRGGPDYPGQWDGERLASADRIVRFVSRVVESCPAAR